MRELIKYFKRLLELGFPGRYNTKSFIIDSANPLTSEIGVSYSLEVMSDAAGLIIVDTAVKGGADYPTDITAGYITFGNFTEVSVTEGIVKAYLV